MADKSTVTVEELGIKLASSLQVNSEGCLQARRRLPKLVSLVNSTALTLRQIRELICQNQDVYKQVCLSDIDSLTARCKTIYDGILILLARKTQSDSRDEEITGMSVETTETLLSVLATKNASRNKPWHWLEPRLKICQQELKQIKFELVLRYLLGSIADLQMKTMTRSPGAYKDESSMRSFAENVAERRAKYYKYFEKKRAVRNRVPSEVPSSEPSLEDVRSIYSRSTTTAVAPPMSSSENECSTPADVARFLFGDEPDSVKNPEKAMNEETETGNKEKPVKDVNLEETDVNTQVSKPQQLNQGFLGAARSWIQRVIPSTAPNDWDGQDIEAFQFDITSHCDGDRTKTVTKLEMDAKHIKATLHKLNSRRRWRRPPGLMEQYTSLDLRVRQAVDMGITIARQSSFHQRTLVAIMTKGSTKGPGYGYEPDFSVTLFLRLGEEVQPIHIIDPCDRKFTLPWQCCLSFTMAQNALARNTSWLQPAHFRWVMERRYDFYNEDDEQVLPDAWESLVRPGVTLHMKFWVPAPPPIPPGGFRPLPRAPGFGWGPPQVKSAVRKIVLTGPEKKKVYHEMVEFLGFEDAWSPNKETMKPGLGNLLSLWTNAVDPDTEDCSDCRTSSSGWSSSSSSSTSSRDIAD